MSGFAPGPWRQHETIPTIVQDANRRLVAVTFDDLNKIGLVSDKGVANKRLILASPDLLHALALAEWTLRCSRDPDQITHARATADAAIRAALSEEDYHALCVEMDARGGQQG